MWVVGLSTLRTCTDCLWNPPDTLRAVLSLRPHQSKAVQLQELHGVFAATLHRAELQGCGGMLSLMEHSASEGTRSLLFSFCMLEI